MNTVTPQPDNRRRKAWRRDALIAEVAWRVAWTTDNTHATALALGMRRDTLERALIDPKRANRPDLWARLLARDVSLDPEQWYSKEWLPLSDPRRTRQQARNARETAARRAAGVRERGRWAAA